MSDTITYYGQQAQKEQSTHAWLASLQSQALKTLEEKGFPSRHDEDWKYTPVLPWLKEPFVYQRQPAVDLERVDDNRPQGQCVVLYNGTVLNHQELALPAGVLLLPLSLALQEHAALVQSYLGQAIESTHGFHALNTAFIQAGIFLYIPEGVVIETPLLFLHWQDKAMQSIQLRHVIVAQANAQATIIEEYQGIGQEVYFTNTITEMWLAAQAEVTHYKIQRESKKAYHIGHLAVKQKAKSTFASHSLSLGAALARSDLSIYLEEGQASCLMNGIYAPGDGQHVDHHTKVHHLVPHCVSEQDYKGILQGRAKGVFNGTVYVAPDAQQTKAGQQNKNLLLSPQAEINTKPQLEIFADDVVCSHGATVGQLDEEALFYLASRGIGKAQAHQYLVHAFAKDNLRLIPHKDWADWMTDLLLQQLG